MVIFSGRLHIPYPNFEKMKFQECIDLLGKPINDVQVVAFLEKYGYTYPKKDTVSNRKNASERSYWIEHKKLKINLLCDADIKNSRYPALQAGTKGLFYPLVSEFRFQDDKTISDFPYGLHFGLSYDEIVGILGQPTCKSSDATAAWLNDDGSESWFQWNVEIDAGREIHFEIEFWPEDSCIRDFVLRIREDYVLFRLYDVLKYETYDMYIDTINNCKTADLMFLRWAVEKGFMFETANNRDVIQDIRNGKSTVFGYLKKLERGYVALEDF